jgi:hypothetical protein
VIGAASAGWIGARVSNRLAKSLKFPKFTFQVIRRTFATLAQKKEP